MTTKLEKRGQVEPHADNRLVNNATDADFFDDENPYNVDRLPRIPGVTFEWHRVSYRGTNDDKNIAQSVSIGWKPVVMDTLIEVAKDNGIATTWLPNKEYSGQEGVVGTHDMILMAIPTEIYDKHKQRIRQRTDSQIEAQRTKFETGLASGYGGQVTALGRDRMPIDD